MQKEACRLELCYHSEPLILLDCAHLLSEARAQGSPARPGAQMEDMLRKLSPPADVTADLRTLAARLDDVQADVLAAAAAADEAAMARYFDAAAGMDEAPGRILALYLSQHDGAPDARMRFRLALATLPGADDDEPPDDALPPTEAALIGLLEARPDLSPAARWMALWLFRHTDEALSDVARLLDAPARAYRRHLDALRPAFSEAMRLTRETLGDRPRETLDALCHLRLDGERLQLFPQAFPWGGLSALQLASPENPLTVHVGCCFWQLYTAARQQADASERLLRPLKALDDRQRLRILFTLRERPRYGKELSALTGLSAATVSHHMSALLSAGLVTLEKQGTQILYHLAPDAVQSLIGDLSLLLPGAD